MSADDTLPEVLRRLQVVKYVQVACITLLMFEWTVALSQEIKHIWKQKQWSATKALYLFSRYSPFLDTPLSVVYYTVPGLSTQFCSRIYTVVNWSTVLGITTSESILVIRTHAIYDHSPKIWRGLWIFGLSLAAISVVCLILWDRSFVFGPPVIAHYAGCNLVDANVDIFGSFLCMLCFDSVIFYLTLRRGLREFRISTDNALINTLYRDGLLFILCLLAFSLGNILLMLTAPREYLDLLATLTRVMHSLISCRIILNLKAAALIELTPASVGTVSDMHDTTSPIVFGRPSPRAEGAGDWLAMEGALEPREFAGANEVPRARPFAARSNSIASMHQTVRA